MSAVSNRIPQELAAVVTVPALLSVARVASVLDCSTRTVRRRIASGELRAVKDHDRVVVRGDDLRQYIDGLERVGRRPARSRRATSTARFGFLRD
jgi:excisionase family DNA binding protein